MFILHHSLSIFSRRQIDDIFLISPENRIFHLMQIVSNGDNLHEISKPVFRDKYEKYFKMSSVEFYTQVVDDFIS